MRKVLLIPILFSFQVMAGTPILEKHSQSGLMLPEDSFEYNCVINDDGVIAITRRNGTGVPLSLMRKMSMKTTNKIKQLIAHAEAGPITEVPPMCDGGNHTLYGYQDGVRLIITEDLDCGTHQINENSASAPLKRIARKFCGF
ncbi:MAG: hypothetical protein ACJ76H_02795 [Bacteriovoracaceae bacterium]